MTPAMTPVTNRSTGWLAACIAGTALAAGPAPVNAQQLEPRAYAANPVGANFVLASVLHNEGEVMLDASVPIEDFEVKANSLLVGYGHTFALGDRLASIGIVVPYARGDATGIVNGEPREVYRSGLGDSVLRITTSLLPGSALDPKSFAQGAPDHTLGASIVLVMPTGQYIEDKLVNLGANRWAFKPELGGSRQFGRWGVDGSIGAWFFTDNDEFMGGSVRSQDPIVALQGHVSYTFRPRMWMSASLTWYEGGQSTVDGVTKDDRQRNTRVGLTFALPVAPRQSVKLSWSTGAATRIGGDFDLIGLTYQYLWFD
jgi:hypothetical protein